MPVEVKTLEFCAELHAWYEYERLSVGKYEVKVTSVMPKHMLGSTKHHWAEHQAGLTALLQNGSKPASQASQVLRP